MTYGYTKQVDLKFDKTVEAVREELKKEGFGVITEIDVKKTMKEKLGIDYEDYLILGACNPNFAHKALEIEKEIGLLLPCNVVVYVSNGITYVSAVNPIESMKRTNNIKLEQVAIIVKEKLESVVDVVEMKGGNKK